MGIPILCVICHMLWEFAKCVRWLTWDERLKLMFNTGFIILVIAAMDCIIIESHKKPITAASSTDTTEQIPPQVENLNQEELPK